MAKGVDIGTCFLVGATPTDSSGLADVSIRSIRDAFLDVENEPATKNMLKMSKVPYIEKGDMLYIVGDPALRIANMLKKEVRRPLSKGVIAAGEKDAEKILYVLLEEVVGKPKTPGEVCFYSVPAPSVDTDMNIAYHEAIFKKILTQFGYTAEPMNEAAAIVYSNAADEGFTALATSCGAGMVNTALLYQTMIGMKFSTARSGDFIDENAAKAVGKTASQIMAIKEQGVNLLDYKEGDPKYEAEREAIIIYYKNMIRYTMDNIKKEFRKSDSSVQINEPIPWILSGGTSKAKNFLELFKQEFDKISDFPISISEIRMASDPLNDVAKGLLIAAMNYSE
jgi:actin-like ATPase involved in cell morphogenesis